MQTMTMTRSLPSVRTQAFVPASRPAARRISRVIVAKGTGPGAGNSDPQKVKEQKDKKKTEGQWAEPSNKNPLEKQTLTRQSPTGQSKGLKDEQNVNDARGDQGNPDGGKNPIQQAGDAIAGAVDSVRPDKE